VTLSLTQLQKSKTLRIKQKKHLQKRPKRRPPILRMTNKKIAGTRMRNQDVKAMTKPLKMKSELLLKARSKIT
jgi:hypothetical protein